VSSQWGRTTGEWHKEQEEGEGEGKGEEEEEGKFDF